MSVPISTSSAGGLFGAVRRVVHRAIDALDRVPYSVLAVPLRLAVATVFWSSAMTKLDDWNAALTLFSDEYKLPLLPPQLAAYLAVSIELTMPVLLVLGLPGSRNGIARPPAVASPGHLTLI